MINYSIILTNLVQTLVTCLYICPWNNRLILRSIGTVRQHFKSSALSWTVRTIVWCQHVSLIDHKLTHRHIRQLSASRCMSFDATGPLDSNVQRRQPLHINIFRSPLLNLINCTRPYDSHSVSTSPNTTARQQTPSSSFVRLLRKPHSVSTPQRRLQMRALARAKKYKIRIQSKLCVCVHTTKAFWCSAWGIRMAEYTHTRTALTEDTRRCRRSFLSSASARHKYSCRRRRR